VTQQSEQGPREAGRGDTAHGNPAPPYAPMTADDLARVSRGVGEETLRRRGSLGGDGGEPLEPTPDGCASRRRAAARRISVATPSRHPPGGSGASPGPPLRAVARPIRTPVRMSLGL
jgi:hypothetical protein